MSGYIVYKSVSKLIIAAHRKLPVVDINIEKRVYMLQRQTRLKFEIAIRCGSCIFPNVHKWLPGPKQNDNKNAVITKDNLI
ncbi:hypothetical protein CHS0354_013873 [Potamilus streckersoni]|uniref:Uncharacterized protein n=1 Tax=Potamilus streckersoni TaxID=2493646 RepID=A0AAE0STW6_9BIVA|nr:hypothetical protein CHS0354_013873 [Potamilus streckersoni]